MKTTVQILKDAKQLLIDKGWTQTVYARDADGKDVLPFDERAACYCALGAICAVGGDWDSEYRVGRGLSAICGQTDVTVFNDTPGRTLDEVLAKFDEAIAAEEAKVLETVA